MTTTKIVAISDTHSKHNKITIPECNLLIHAGDESFRGEKHEMVNFAKWLNKQPAKYKIWTPGNHSVEFEKHYPESKNWLLEHCSDLKILVHESIEIEGIKIFASPWSPYFFNWSYNAGRTLSEAAYYQKPFIGDLWKDIPDDTEILITHGPPYEILDELANRDGTPSGIFVGCVELRNRIKELAHLDLFFCGHIHANGNQQRHIDGVSYYNVSICDEIYYPSNEITIVDYIRE